jgi:hypothetical protein
MSYSLLTKRTSMARLVIALVSLLALEVAPGAAVVLHLQKGALGRQLVVLTVAKTPKAKARKLSGIKLPRAGR